MSSDLLVVIYDVSPFAWGAQSEKAQTDPNALSFTKMSEQLLVFINSFLLLNRENRVAVILTHPSKSLFAYPGPESKNESKRDSHVTVDAIISEHLKQLASIDVSDKKDTGPLLSGALSLGLCYINRLKSEISNLQARMLVLSASSDVSSQYVPVMNCIFSAQKQSVPVDSCVLANEDSLFLQQASHLTEGIYFKPPLDIGVLQYLLTIFLPDLVSRKYMVLPQNSNVDYRATCFCHRNVIEVGFVCPVCLSVFCRAQTQCSTCGTRYMVVMPVAARPKVAAVRRAPAKQTFASSSSSIPPQPDITIVE